MSQEASASAFQDLAKGNWEADLLNDRHLIFVNEEFPAQVDVILDDKAWQISLHVYNPKRGIMDLLSSEYTAVLSRNDVKGVREEISAYIEAIESGNLDDYRDEKTI